MQWEDPKFEAMPKASCGFHRDFEVPLTNTAQHPLVSNLEARELCKQLPDDRQSYKYWSQAVKYSYGLVGSAADSATLESDARQARRGDQPHAGRCAIREVIAPGDLPVMPKEHKHRPFRRQVQGRSHARGWRLDQMYQKEATGADIGQESPHDVVAPALQCGRAGLDSLGFDSTTSSCWGPAAAHPQKSLPPPNILPRPVRCRDPLPFSAPEAEVLRKEALGRDSDRPFKTQCQLEEIAGGVRWQAKLASMLPGTSGEKPKTALYMRRQWPLSSSIRGGASGGAGAGHCAAFLTGGGPLALGRLLKTPGSYVSSSDKDRPRQQLQATLDIVPLEPTAAMADLADMLDDAS